MGRGRKVAGEEQNKTKPKTKSSGGMPGRTSGKERGKNDLSHFHKCR